MNAIPRPQDEAANGSRLHALNQWVADVAALTRPDRIHWCDGSQAEYDALVAGMAADGTLLPLNPETHPGCWLHRSDPRDVARVEHLTFVCTRDRDAAGANNHWMAPDAAHAKMDALFDGCMRGRTLYVVPYCMGPIGSKLSRCGVEITDSPYVVANMRLMTRMGADALARIEREGTFVRGLHSTGELDPDRRFIMHFPEELSIKSYGSGYGGNALLGKKCHALRIASWQARQEGWLAEHMLIVGIENPRGETHYIAAAFPSACGKTNLAMLVPPAGYDGWKVTCVGDDIAWLWPHEDGKLHAINPEAGYFGVAPMTSYETNPNAMDSLKENSIFTNVALTDDGDVWWEDMTPEPPAHLIDWKGNDWTSESEGPSSHPNARFTAPASQCPVIDPEWQNPDGVPIDAFVFGGRRATTMPLVFQAHNWNHGTFIGSVMGSEMTAAAAGGAGQVRRDPMAMLPFCGHHVGDYLQLWIDIASKVEKLPEVFHVNWFRKDPEGNWLWPGFGQNMRVLEWILKRADGTVEGKEEFVGTVPAFGELNLDGLDFSEENWDALMNLDAEEWQRELETQEEFLDKIGDKLPGEIKAERAKLLERVGGG